jgi:predicted site-specific integrase-resolvase
MIVTKPDVALNGLYSQRQAAEALQIDRHTVAAYAADGLIKFKVRKAGKRLVTTGAEIIKCWQSTYL